jgi:hypothetical protein
MSEHSMPQPKTKPSHERFIVVGAVVWAIVGSVIAIATLAQSNVNRDARALVTVVSVVCSLCAAGAAWLMHNGKPRKAGPLLVISAATPTYFAWILNIPALVVGLALLVRRSHPREKH